MEVLEEEDFPDDFGDPAPPPGGTPAARATAFADAPAAPATEMELIEEDAVEAFAVPAASPTLLEPPLSPRPIEPPTTTAPSPRVAPRPRARAHFRARPPACTHITHR